MGYTSALPRRKGPALIVYLKVLAAAMGLLKMTGPFKGECRVRAIHEDNGEAFIDLPVNAETKSKAVLSLFWNSRQSHAVVQAEPLQTSDTLVRYKVLRKLTNDLPAVGDPVSLSGWLGSTPEHFGLEGQYKEVQMPNRTIGWFFPGESDTWVIHVHGRRAGMGETLRNVAQFAKTGYTQLTISMKTDPKPYGFGHKISKLGHTEWIELEQAVRFARQSGAKKVILVGWSQGALISSLFLIHSSEASIVHGAIFDSPLLDYRNTMRYQAERSGYDKVMGDRVIETISHNKLIRLFGYRNVDVDAISLVRDTLLPDVPVLVLYSMNDGHVAIEDVHKFASMNPAVNLVEIPNARHCRLFNEDQPKYQESISSWISEHQI
jgi:pimeloyl-ACP methyl ester carboxylesterase